MKHLQTVALLFLSTTILSTFGAASLDTPSDHGADNYSGRNRRDADDLQRLNKLDSGLKYMGNLKKMAGQRRSDDVSVDPVPTTQYTTTSTTTTTATTTTTTAAPAPPFARMASDDGYPHTHTVVPTATAASSTSPKSVYSSTTGAPVPTSTTTSASYSSDSSTKGNSRGCLHPKDVNCKKETKGSDGKYPHSNISVGVNK
jgi:hypothetical protein